MGTAIYNPMQDMDVLASVFELIKSANKQYKLNNNVPMNPALKHALGLSYSFLSKENNSDWQWLEVATKDRGQQPASRDDAHRNQQILLDLSAGWSLYRLRYAWQIPEGRSYILQFLTNQYPIFEQDERNNKDFQTIWRESNENEKYRLYDLCIEGRKPDRIRQAAAIFALDRLRNPSEIERSQRNADRGRLSRFVEIYQFFISYSTREWKRMKSKKMSSSNLPLDEEYQAFVTYKGIGYFKEQYDIYLTEANYRRVGIENNVVSFKKAGTIINILDELKNKVNLMQYGSIHSMVYHAIKHVAEIERLYPDVKMDPDAIIINYLKTAREAIEHGSPSFSPIQLQNGIICKFNHNFPLENAKPLPMLTMVRYTDQGAIILTSLSKPVEERPRYKLTG